VRIMDKKILYGGIIGLVVILIIIGIFIIPKDKVEITPTEPMQKRDCTGVNDVYMHCLSLVDNSDNLCSSDEWAHGEYELQKDKDFCRYWRGFKEAVIKDDKEACLDIMDLPNYYNYDCSSEEDFYGCNEQPLTCYVSLSDDETCDGVDQIKINGFPQKERRELCEGLNRINKIDKPYEDPEFINADSDNKKVGTMVLAIKRKDPSLCKHIGEEFSRSYVSCELFSTIRKEGLQEIPKEFCEQFKKCDPNEGLFEEGEVKSLQQID